MSDTGMAGMPRRRLTLRLARALRARAGFGIALLLALAPVRSEPAELAEARVVLARSGRVYVALVPAVLAEVGDSVRFEDRGRPVASGLVSSVVHDELAVVSLSWGSLDRVKKLERVRVIVTRPPVVARATLRIALPSNDRGNLLFRCGDVAPRLPANAPAYRTERVDGHLLRLTRELPSPPQGLWPDTLLVYLFSDPRDEEIALERGDVDIAVFWPGELSRRVREDARWNGFPLGVRSRGVIALIGDEGVARSGPDSASAAGFNDALFRGDLALRWTIAARGGRWSDLGGTVGVDESVPGLVALRTWFARRKGVTSVTPPLPDARLVYLDVPGDAMATGTFQPVFRVQCPIVCAAPLRPLVNALGPGVFADMPACALVPKLSGP